MIQIRLCNPVGADLYAIRDFSSVSYVRGVNTVGSLALSLHDNYNMSDFADDSIIVAERRVGNFMKLDMDTFWWVRYRDRKLESNGLWTRTVECVDAIELLDRRGVPYADSTTYGVKSGAIDDVMKEIVDENFGASATDAARNLSTYLNIQDDYTAAAAIAGLKIAHEKSILSVLSALAKQSTELGTYLAFDVAPSGPIPQLEFRTYIGQRGIDRGQYSDDPLVFSVQRGNLADIESVIDSRNERNCVYVFGSGSGSNRPYQQVSNSSRMTMSPFNRRELLVDGGNSKTDDALLAIAYNNLRAGLPLRSYKGKALDIDGCRYGVDWNFGDVVVMDTGLEQIDVHMDAVKVTIDPNGQQTVEVLLQYEA